MEKHVGDLVEGMVGLGHQVFVVCPNGEPSELYKRLGAIVFIDEIKHSFDFGFIYRLSKFLSQNKIDLTHSHELKAVCNTLIASFLAGVKVRITHTHTPISAWGIPLFSKLVNMATNSFLVNLLSSAEIALTEEAKKQKQKELILKSKLLIVPNGIRVSQQNLNQEQKKENRETICSRYKIPKDSFIVGNISRLSAEKGYDLLIEAFKVFVDKNNAAFLLIAGDGPLRTYYEEKLKSLGLEARALITGYYAEEDKAKLLAALDVLVFSSNAEGFGYVPLEALTFETPVVCSDLEVIKEVCKDNVVYFSQGSVESLLKTLELVKATGYPIDVKKAKAFITATYSVEQFWENYNSLYQKLYESAFSK